MNHGLKALMIYIAAVSIALAQTTGAADRNDASQIGEERTVSSVESERARLGQQRIQADAELRAREEQRRLEAEEQRRLRAQEETTISEEAIAPTSEARPTSTDSGADMSRTLMQLRSLGELKDDGYITEDEFRRIKQKILDSQL